MLGLTVRNVVLIAVMQVGVVVMGVLAAGVSQRWWAINGTPIPVVTILVQQYGMLAFTIPLLWTISILRLRLRSEVSDRLKAAVFAAGIAILITLIAIMGYAIIRPWFSVD